MSISITQLLFSLGIAQGFVISAVFFFTPYFRSRANDFLAATILSIALLGFLGLFDKNEATESLIFANDLMWEYIVPATMYGYFVRLLAERDQILPIRWTLYLPFFVTLVINLIIDGGDLFHFYQLPFTSDNYWLALYYMVEEIGTIIFGAVVMIHIYQMIKRSEARPTTQKWAEECFLFFVVLLVVWTAAWLGSQAVNQDLSKAIWVAVSMIFSVLIYRGVFQFKLAEERFEIKGRLNKFQIATSIGHESDVEQGITPAASVSMTGSPHRYPEGDVVEIELSTTRQLAREDCTPLSATEEVEHPSGLVTDQYLVALDRLMDVEKLYRTATLNRSEVAEALGISPGYLSRKISGHPAGNFTEYVNSYRVEEVKKMLSTPAFDAYSLTAIGLEAGFNSKSAFYKAFKSGTGHTPSEYKAKVRE